MPASPPLELELVARALADGIALGRQESRRTGRGVEFAGHRAYNAGDDARTIDWRAYARSDRLLIRDAEIDADHLYWLVIDTSGSMDLQNHGGGRNEGRTKLEAAKEIAATLALVAQRQGDRFGLIAWGQRWQVLLEPGRGLPWLQRLFGLLDSLQTDTGPVDAKRSEMHLPATQQSCDVLVLTDAYDRDGDILKALSRLEHPRRRLRMIALEAHQESQPGGRWASGAVVCQDLETGEKRYATAAALREGAARREAFLGRIEKTLRARGIAFSRLGLAEDWTRALNRVLTPGIGQERVR